MAKAKTASTTKKGAKKTAGKAAPAKKAAATKTGTKKPTPAAGKTAGGTSTGNPADLPTSEDVALVSSDGMPPAQTAAPAYILVALADPKVAAALKAVAAGRVPAALLGTFDEDLTRGQRAAGAAARFSNAAAIASNWQAPPASRLATTFATVMKSYDEIAALNPKAGLALAQAKAAWDSHHSHGGGTQPANPATPSTPPKPAT